MSGAPPNARAILVRLAESCTNPNCPCHIAEVHGHGSTHCPCHDDPLCSLDVSEVNGQIAVACARGCAGDAVIGQLLDLGVWPYPAHGVTLEQLAEAKRLSVAFLRDRGVKTEGPHDAPRVLIPYSDERQQFRAARLRLSLDTAPKFKWHGGDESRACLYGLSYLPGFVQRFGWVLIVWSESDVWTAWRYDLPALALTTAWRDEWGAPFRQGHVETYIWLWPDQPLPEEIINSVPNLRVIFAPPGVRDLSDAHLRGNDVAALVRRHRDLASTAEQARREEDERRRADVAAEALRTGKSVLDDPHPLDRIGEALAESGLVGNLDNALIVELALVSRSLGREDIVSLLVLGPSASGKNYLVDAVVALHPVASVVEFNASSDLALVYGEDFRHRMMYVKEAAGLPRKGLALTLMRSVLSEGRIVYRTVRMKKNGPEPVVVVREGPTGLIATSTRKLEYEWDTRVLTVPMLVSPDQTHAINRERGRRVEEGASSPDFSAIVAAHAWIATAGIHDVVLPFGKKLGMLADTADPRMHRDLPHLIGLIKAHALLCQRHRAKDAHGRIVATPRDYRTMHKLTARMFIAPQTSGRLTPGGREAIKAVADLCKELGRPVTYTEVGQRLGGGITRTSAMRRLLTAERLGIVVNEEPNDRLAGRLVPGHPAPEEKPLFPSPDVLFEETP